MILINLLPDDLRISGESKWKFLHTPLIKAVFGLAALLLAGQVFLIAFAIYRAAELGMIKKEVEQLTEANKGIALRKTQIVDLKKRIADIDSVIQRKFYWSQFLNALTDSVTKGIWLRSFSLAYGPLPPPVRGKDKTIQPPAPRTLRMEGSAVAPPGQETAYVARFIKELKGNALLGNLLERVELLNINQRKIKDVDVYDFVLVCTFKKDLF